MLTPDLTRAARALLSWSQTELAEHANLSLSTVRDFENATRTNLLKNNLAGLQTAFEREGVVFDYPLGSDEASVRRVAKNTNLAVVADPRWPTGCRRL